MNIKHTERQRRPREREDLVSAKSMLAESRNAEVCVHLKYGKFFKRKKYSPFVNKGSHPKQRV